MVISFSRHDSSTSMLLSLISINSCYVTVTVLLCQQHRPAFFNILKSCSIDEEMTHDKTIS